MRSASKKLVPLTTVAMLASCSFHSTATHWHGLIGTNGKPVFVKTTTNVGFNLAIIIPFLGNTTMDRMVDTTAGEIAEKGGNNVRVIQTTNENYWHGFPPFTWIVTPVITDVAIEYEPSEQEVTEVLAAEQDAAKNFRERPPEDTSHVIPEPRR